GRGMVGVRSLDLACILAGAQLGLLDDCAPGFWIWERRDRGQLYRHHSLYAVPGDEAKPNASAGLDESCDGGHGAHRDHALNGRATYVARRPLSRRTLFRHAGGWLRGNLDAFF